MPNYVIDPTGRVSDRKDLPVDFAKVPMLGNAGPKINQFIYDGIVSPYVTPHDDGFLAPGGGLKPNIVTKLRSKRSLLQDFLMQFNQANPTSAELQPGERPNGQMPTAEQLAEQEGKIPAPKVLPMWLADP